jgi:hypothetical protein
MSQVLKLRRKATRIAGVGASLGALALGGSALADAATNKSSTTSTTGTSTTAPGSQGSAPHGAQQGRPQRDPTTPGGHVGANGTTEAALPADVAAKVKAAAEAKVSGGTVERVETDVDHGSPYEAHVRKADGTEVEVLVNSSFDVTAVNTMQHR